MAQERTSATSFSEVLSQESKRVDASRDGRNANSNDNQQLVGLALSGGGIRSAIFSLGVLQALARFGLLNRLDYVSSTGGGSYIAGWLAAWIQRSDYREVNNQLCGGNSGTAEAPEIHRLRESTSYLLTRSIAGSSTEILIWMRNVALNLVSLAAVLGAFLLLTKVALDVVSSIPQVVLEFAAVFAVIAAVMLGVHMRRHEQPTLASPVRPGMFWMAVIASLAAAAMLGVGMGMRIAPYGGLETTSILWIVYGCALGFFCVVAWFPRGPSIKIFLVHLTSALTAGAAGGFLLSQLYLWTPALSNEARTAVTTPLIVFSGMVTVLLYMFLMGRWISRSVRELCGRFCLYLLNLAAVWLLVALIWNYPQVMPSVWLALAIAIVVVVAGLLKAGGLTTASSLLQIPLDLLERMAPYLFVLGLASAVATPLTPLVRESSREAQLMETAVAAGFLLIALFLMWRMRANDFTMHSFHRARVARSYLAPASSMTRPHTSQLDDDDDMMLSDFGEATYTGPYPLFGAAVDVTESGPSGSWQTRTVPFLFSPAYSGFDATQTRDALSPREAYRPTREFGGGISVATAMAISEPLRGNRLRPPSAAAAFLWTIFDMRDGRWMGNPRRDDTWNKSGPLVGAAYALWEGFRRLAGEPAYVRPSAGGEFDNLGIYALLKRRCRFIIACDASKDPLFAFEDLGATIRRCRTELGVEIEIDLGSLGRNPNASRAHCQIAVIRYTREETGLMLYIKPSLTGDEPSDLIQYANAHPKFPITDSAAGNFDQPEFESYRRLGQHIVESLLTEIERDKKLAEMPIDRVFYAIRRRLQPDFKEPVTAPEPAAKPPDAPPAELVDTIASGECVLCAGAGLAAQAGLPTWPAFLQGLLLFGKEKGIIDQASATGLAATVAEGELEAPADELSHQIPRELLLEYVRSSMEAAQLSQAHLLLAQMPFLGALNTNLDELLGAAFKSRSARLLVPANTEELVAALQSKAFFVANVLGVTSQPSSLLFTVKEFRALLAANLQFKQFLRTLFLRYNVFFVGSSIDGIREYLEALELPQTPERRHYALVAHAGQLDPVKLRYLERSYNLQIVEYQPQFNHAGLSEFLEQLLSGVNEKAPRVRRSGALVLKSVTLDNIGPFESLHLDLTPSWNVLLGDNGMGKTVVLRAIAAALCGEKADQPMVTRLLRSGTASGSIRLKVEDREYTVELKRDTDGNVQITSHSLSPLKFDNWLVLGFPALRSIPWNRPTGPHNLKPQGPSTDDLLPVLRAEPDGRVADIKQWLVNLDYASKSETQSSRSKKLIEGFYEVLQRLTPDMLIEPGSIDPKTMEITIKTDSGLVPLEAVSQGTGSVMCWIGTLLERLSEAGNEPDPKESAALVLIDEIDAHMHPKWQQLFVSAFRDQFKSVQVIATTHSPLLVSSLKRDEIWRVHRAPLRSEIYGVAHLEKTTDGRHEIVILGPEADPEERQPSAKREERRYRIPSTVELLVKEGEIVEEQEPLTKGALLVAEKIRYGQEGLRADQILTGPLFNLETTRDPDTMKLMSDYTRLSNLTDPDEKDKKDLAEAAGKLRVRLPTAKEKEAAREAYDIIHNFAMKQVQDLPPEKRREVLDEVKVQMTESITGSRRPE